MNAEPAFGIDLRGLIEVKATAGNLKLLENDYNPVYIRFTALVTGKTLVVTMKEREAKALAAELYAASDGAAHG